MAHSESAQGHSSRDCQRTSSVHSLAKRAMQPRQGDQQTTLQQQQTQRQPQQSYHQQVQPLLQQQHTSSLPAQEIDSMHTTSARVTTVVTMTPTSATAFGGRYAAGTAIEQDEVEVQTLPSPGWKRSRVQQTASRDNMTQVTGTRSVARASKKSQRNNHNSSSSSTSSSRRSSYGNGSRAVRPSIPQAGYARLSYHDDEHTGAKRENASDEERGNGRDTEASADSSRSTRPAVTQESTSGAGNQRGSRSQTLPLYHHCNQHHIHRHICNATNTISSPTTASTRNVHQTHSRNYSSPSLLDSFTSPEPMLSPIQSYFGSDPSLPASSFSLPRHDQYPRLTVDPSASMDGYHGFATHPWSEQSTTPSSALSHRWTRRLSQSDIFPLPSGLSSNNRTRMNGNTARVDSRHRHSSIGLSRPFAPAAMDRPWDTASSASNVETTQGSETDLDQEHESIMGDELMQESNDDEETAMGESFGGNESNHDHHYDYNRSLRTLDDDDDVDEEESRPSQTRAAHEIMERDAGERMEDADSSLDADMDESEEDRDSSQSDHAEFLNRFYTPPSPASSTSPSHFTGRNNSNEALARRLQDEEYSAMMGERGADDDYDALMSVYRLRSLSLRSLRLLSSLRRSNVNRVSRRVDETPLLPSVDDFLPPVVVRDPIHRTVEGYNTRVRASWLTGARPSLTDGHSQATDSSQQTRSESGLYFRVRERERERLANGLSGVRSNLTDRHMQATDSSQQTHSGTRNRSGSSPVLSSLEARLEESLQGINALNRTLQRMSNNMWGNPADYLNDDQVDNSYEGLLRLSERIGDAKPKGVSASVLKALDHHVVSWKQMRARNTTLSMPPKSTLAVKGAGDFMSDSTLSPFRGRSMLSSSSSSSSSSSPLTPYLPEPLSGSSPSTRHEARSRGLMVTFDNPLVDETWDEK
ncbi:hypothetical protein EDD11_001502 [Mortierella claussenii]|nr:hypothetical protein EDD11_001502 [Mortierella claussenii]